jgi:ArsR family transcriptional regulator
MDRSILNSVATPVKISKALADETRLRIFEAISATDHMNSSEIVLIRGVTPATVSHHLKILSEAGLIICRREGQFVYSKAVPKPWNPTCGRSRESRAAREQRATDSRQSVGRTSWKYLDTPSARPDGSLIGEFRSLQNHSNFLLFKIAWKLVTVGAGGRHGKYRD